MSQDFERARRARPLIRVIEEEGRDAKTCPICASAAELVRHGKWSEAFIEDLRSQTDLIRTVEGTTGCTQWKRSGANFLQDCPFCHAKDGLNVHPEKRVWKCFHCGKGGKDAISWVMAAEEVDFPDAVRHLIQQTGAVEVFAEERQWLKCTNPGCEAFKMGDGALDEVGFLAVVRGLDRRSASAVYLQESGITQGERLAPTLRPGASRRKGKVGVEQAEGPAQGEGPRAKGEGEGQAEAKDPIQNPKDQGPNPKDQEAGGQDQGGEAKAAPESVPVPAPAPGAVEGNFEVVPSSAGSEAVLWEDEAPQKPEASGRVQLVGDQVRAALREFWSRTSWSAADRDRFWKKRGLVPHTARVFGMRSNPRTNLEILKDLTSKFPVSVLVASGLWAMYAPDGEEWLQSPSEAGGVMQSGARPSEFFFGKGMTGERRVGREKRPVYGWNEQPIIPYWDRVNPQAEGAGRPACQQAVVTEGEFKAMALWQTHALTAAELAAWPDPDPERILALRPHKHWARGAEALPFLCPPGAVAVAAVPGITFAKADSPGGWTVRHYLDEYMRWCRVREVMIAYDNEDKVSRFRCRACGNTDTRLAIEHWRAEGRKQTPRLDAGAAVCCGRRMAANPGFKVEEERRWDSVVWALVLGDELRRVGLEARFMQIPDEFQDLETGKADWDGVLAAMLHERRQEDLFAGGEPVEEPASVVEADEDDLPMGDPMPLPDPAEVERIFGQ